VVQVVHQAHPVQAAVLDQAEAVALQEVLVHPVQAEAVDHQVVVDQVELQVVLVRQDQVVVVALQEQADHLEQVEQVLL
jgi:hypothetical protein